MNFGFCFELVFDSDPIYENRVVSPNEMIEKAIISPIRIIASKDLDPSVANKSDGLVLGICVMVK